MGSANPQNMKTAVSDRYVAECTVYNSAAYRGSCRLVTVEAEFPSALSQGKKKKGFEMNDFDALTWHPNSLN